MSGHLLSSVRQYLKLGWLPIPVKPETKVPAIQAWKGLQDPANRPTDEEILGLFKEQDNIAILCGRASGNLVIIDFDEHSDLASQLFGGNIEKETAVSRTGRTDGTGRHYFFTCEELPKNTKIAGLGELRSDGNYVVVPPSKHPSGNNYEWLNEPEKIKRVQNFNWFFERAKELGFQINKSATLTNTPEFKKHYQPYAGPDPPVITELLDGVPEGGRDDASVVYASWLLTWRKLNPELAWNRMVEWNQKNKPPLVDAQLRKCFDSADKNGYLYTSRFFPNGLRNAERNKSRITYRPFGTTNQFDNTPFYEQALVDGKLSFITIDGSGRIDVVSEIVVHHVDNSETIIRPQTNLPYEEYIVKKEWFENPETNSDDNIWAMGSKLLTEYVDFLEPCQCNLSMASTKVSYFNEAFQALPYLYAVGDTESGKSRWAKVLLKLCYRPLYGDSPPSADIYEFITNSGNVIIEDEAQGFEKDVHKLKIYKSGYQAGAKVARIQISRNTGERHQSYYNVYGLKIFAGEELAKNRGFLDRLIILPFVKGKPQKDEFDPKDEAAFQEVRGRLLAVRITFLAKKSKAPEYACEEAWFEGRSKELYKPLLAVTPDSEREPILEAARRRYEDKRADLSESIEAKTIIAYQEAVKENKDNRWVPTEKIYNRLMTQIDKTSTYPPTIQSTGQRLTKLGFKRALAMVAGKKVRVRYADDLLLNKLVRKYNLVDAPKVDPKALPAHSLEGSSSSVGSDSSSATDEWHNPPESKHNCEGTSRGTDGTGGTDSPDKCEPDIEKALGKLRQVKGPFSDDYAVEQIMKTGMTCTAAEAFLKRMINEGLLARDPEGYLRLVK